MSRYAEIIICLLLCNGCSAPVEEPLKVGVNPWVGYDPLVLAQGDFDRNSVVRIVELMSNSESIRALRNGLLDGAALTLDEALRLADSGTEIKIVALLDTSHGADAVLARPDIQTPAHLKNKRIALEKTALGALMLDKVLQAGQLMPEEVETLHVEAAQHAEIIKKGLADALISFEPMKSHLLAENFHSIFDSSQIPGHVIDVLVVRAGVPTERTAHLLKLWVNGLKKLMSDPASAAALLSRGADLSDEDYLATLQGLHFVPLEESLTWLSGPQPILIEKADAIVKVLKRLSLLKKQPEWSVLLDAEPARWALKGDKKP